MDKKNEEQIVKEIKEKIKNYPKMTTVPKVGTPIDLSHKCSPYFKSLIHGLINSKKDSEDK